MANNQNDYDRLKNLVIILGHELGVALEMAYEPSEIRQIWGDAVDALRETRDFLEKQGLEVPSTIENVIKSAEEKS